MEWREARRRSRRRRRARPGRQRPRGLQSKRRRSRRRRRARPGRQRPRALQSKRRRSRQRKHAKPGPRGRRSRRRRPAAPGPRRISVSSRKRPGPSRRAPRSVMAPQNRALHPNRREVKQILLRTRRAPLARASGRCRTVWVPGASGQMLRAITRSRSDGTSTPTGALLPVAKRPVHGESTLESSKGPVRHLAPGKVRRHSRMKTRSVLRAFHRTPHMKS